MACLDIPNETVFTMEMTPIKFGPGSTDEVAYDLKRFGVPGPAEVISLEELLSRQQARKEEKRQGTEKEIRFERIQEK